MSTISPTTKIRLEAELLTLDEDRIRAVAVVEVAQGAGDVAENPDVQLALAELARIDARRRSVGRILKDAQVVQSSGETVEAGCLVGLDWGDGDVEIFLFGSIEDRASSWVTLSSSSPVGMAVAGARVGDSVALSSGSTVGVVSIEVL